LSLILEALKKVEEAGRPGNGPGASGRPDALTIASKRGIAFFARISLIVVMLILAGLYLYVRSRHTPSAPLYKAAYINKQAASTPTDHNANAVGYYRAGRYRHALAEFEAGIKSNPGDAVSHNNAGLAAMILGDAALAEAHFKDALLIQPAYPEALNNYGAFLDSRRTSLDGARAVEFFERALETAPGYADAELNLAIALERLGKTENAATHYERFIRSDQTGQGHREAAERLGRLAAEGKPKRPGGR